MGNCNSEEVHVVDEAVFEMLKHLFEVDLQLGLHYLMHYLSLNIAPVQKQKLISLIPKPSSSA